MDLQTRSHDGAIETLEGSNQHAADRTRLRFHTVQFYEDDAVFLDGLSEFAGSALGTGGACLVIATEMHREKLSERLKGWGIDVPFATQNGRYISLDAEGTLAEFMVDGWPNETLFCNVIEPVLLRAKVAIQGNTPSIFAFGEMVALLWSDGKREAAIRLEQLWNRLALRHSFSLRCAYPMESFGEEGHQEPFRQICAEHGQVMPAESYTTLDNEDERLRMVSSLQQKAQTLQAAVAGREREITQRKHVEEKLRQSEQFAKKVVESGIDCVKVLDLEGRLEYMSPPGQKALEIDDITPFLGRPWVEFWSEEDRPAAEAAVITARAGAVGSFRGGSPTLGGMQKSWDVKITPALDKEGKPERLIAVSRDVTELKCAQRAVIRAEKLAATGRLAATIAHEINNPLEAVTNFIYLAKTSEGVPEEVCRHLEIADQELARVAQIAQQTLGFYRDNAKQKWLSVSEVIRDVMMIFQRKLDHKRLKVEVSAGAELKLYAKQGELKQALSNLIANSIDASKEGGKLSLRAHRTKNWTRGMEDGVRITLADSGSGMPPEVQRRLFVPFFTTKSDAGTGIGLWVTKTLIEKQGGYMRFRSRQGHKAGTVISFFLPCPMLSMP